MGNFFDEGMGVLGWVLCLLWMAMFLLHPHDTDDATNCTLYEDGSVGCVTPDGLNLGSVCMIAEMGCE